jgi:hypothetical protein
MTLQQAAADAIACQDACNLSGVAHSLIDALDAIRETAEYREGGTRVLNQHPIVTLYLAKLADLNRMDYSWPIQAWEECKRLAGEEGAQ